MHINNYEYEKQLIKDEIGRRMYFRDYLLTDIEKANGIFGEQHELDRLFIWDMIICGLKKQLKEFENKTMED